MTCHDVVNLIQRGIIIIHSSVPQVSWPKEMELCSPLLDVATYISMAHFFNISFSPIHLHITFIEFLFKGFRQGIIGAEPNNMSCVICFWSFLPSNLLRMFFTGAHIGTEGMYPAIIRRCLRNVLASGSQSDLSLSTCKTNYHEIWKYRFNVFSVLLCFGRN